jgi:alanine-glyoxylate transaminase/serine-glyoxylate transaminase/serine-pyruvate transaminase
MQALNERKVRFGEPNLPPRLLLGPGPSNIPPRVNLKLASPIVGYMDPAYFAVMEDVKTLMRYLFQTNNSSQYQYLVLAAQQWRCVLQI